MKLYVIAGEASGDLHASNLMKCIRKIHHEADFRCFGGDLMKEAGGVIVKHYREMNFMGIWEVIRNYGKIRKNIADCKADILFYKPDALILVDYAGFNLRIAEFARKNNYRVFYYISPKLWAWGKWRVKKVRQYVDRMFVNLPFEVDFYRDHGVDAEFYGNPVVDSVAAGMQVHEDYNSFIHRHALEDKPIIALLAGSRKQEIDLCLPEMLAVTEHYPGYQFVITGAPSLHPEFYHPYIEGKDVHLIHGQTYSVLRHAAAAVVTSGTATLETALHRIPQVVIYKTSRFTYFVGRPFVDIKFFSLVNLIMDDEVVKELLQYNLAGNIKTELDRILFDKHYRQQMLENYDRLIEKTGSPGVSERVARRISELLLI
ncbi:MAG: lipid-A-disaccharide synthase [Bacteroidales bacterium]|nr:lipid-A-disaccharide synthase [Bacteroidales bacterium]